MYSVKIFPKLLEEKETFKIHQKLSWSWKINDEENSLDDFFDNNFNDNVILRND
jgi:hypothetical protein